MKFKEFNSLTEGINDKSILKAMFIVGVAASGKSTISKPLSFYAKHIDVDYPQEYYSEKYDIDLGRDGDIAGKRRLRETAKRITTTEIVNYIDGMLPMVINVVGDDIERTTTRIKILRNFGYDVGMIYINADIENALKRVKARRYGKDKDRHRFINQSHVYDSYHKLIVNAKKYQDALYDGVEGNVELLDFFDQIQNNGYIDDGVVTKIHVQSKKFFEGPVKNPKGEKILAQLKETKGKMISDIISKSEITDQVAKWF